MKNLILILFLLMVATGCSTIKRTPDTSKGSGQPDKSTRAQSSPRFINTISINNAKEAGSKNNSTSTVRSGSTQIMNVPDVSMEMLYPLQFKYAILMDIPVEEVTDHKLIEFLESWYGTPYRLGGTTKNGVDCSFFAQSFMLAIYSISLPRTSKAQYDDCLRIHKKKLKEGDLVFFHTQGRKTISHVGVYLRNNKFAHASTSWGVMISDMNEEYYSKRFAGAGRVAGVSKSVGRLIQ